MSFSHISLPSRARSCRSMWLCLGNQEGRSITDITLSFHHFLTGDLLSSTDWASTPTRILVLLREHGWGDSHSKIIVFPISTSRTTERSHGATPCPLEWQSPFLTCWTPSLRTGSPHPVDLKISFLWRACIFLGEINHLPKPHPLPWHVSVKDPRSWWWPPLLLTNFPRCPTCQQCSDAESKSVFV